MKTKLTPSPQIAAQFLLRGEPVAFPTETVYGLGADVFDESALQKIFVAKQRPPDNPLIVHISHLSYLDLLVSSVPEFATKFIEAFWPAPLTLVMPKSKYVPLLATGGLQTVGVRMPKHELAQQFLAACGVPVAAPSANLSGRPSPTSWQAVKEDLDGRIACILKGAATEIGLESTVVDCTGKTPVLLRPGAVTLEQLQAVVPSIKLFSAGTKGSDAAKPPPSPGMKYRHYAPEARVIIIEPPFPGDAAADAAYIGLEKIFDTSLKLKKICRSLEDYAASLFEFFREADRLGAKVIYCQAVGEEGLGLALMNRLRKAVGQSESPN
ncbi:MAG: threonylcarbamoyl-AMP synthase [Rhizobacter sp.]|nr:threonylcarbamoyl-AMP synthase [Chlorobiales bacterium]